MNKDTNTVDLDKLTSSLKIIDEVNNSLNNTSLSNIVLELDNELNKLNFEHGNCLKDYKEDLDNLTIEIDKLKTDINEFNIALDKTVKSFSNVEDIKQSDLLNNVSQLPTTEIKEDKTVNTVPVGLGIAASGIAGSVGAVVVDSMFHNEEKDTIPDYDEPRVEVVEKKKPEFDESIARETKFDDVTPYHASRDKEELSKFYDENS